MHKGNDVWMMRSHRNVFNSSTLFVEANERRKELGPHKFDFIFLMTESCCSKRRVQNLRNHSWFCCVTKSAAAPLSLLVSCLCLTFKKRCMRSGHTFFRLIISLIFKKSTLRQLYIRKNRDSNIYFLKTTVFLLICSLNRVYFGQKTRF